MKKYIIFFRNGVEILGSDKLAYIDGRWGFARINRHAHEVAHQKRKLQLGINGFKIHSGSLREETKGKLYPINIQP